MRQKGSKNKTKCQYHDRNSSPKLLLAEKVRFFCELVIEVSASFHPAEIFCGKIATDECNLNRVINE